jgi:hypothetical protein
LLVTNLARLSSGTIEQLREGSSAPEPAAAAPDASRPVEIGNAVAEDFTRKLKRPSGIPDTKLIRLSDESFSAAYDELYDRRDAYYGREIELAGYVPYACSLAHRQRACIQVQAPSFVEWSVSASLGRFMNL